MDVVTVYHLPLRSTHPCMVWAVDIPAMGTHEPLPPELAEYHEETVMGNTDDLKGRAKEAAGDLTDDKDLKREGKLDQTEGKAKDMVDKARDKISGEDKR